MDAASGSVKRVGWNLLRAVKNVRMEKSHYYVRSRKPGQDVTVRVGTKRKDRKVWAGAGRARGVL